VLFQVGSSVAHLERRTCDYASHGCMIIEFKAGVELVATDVLCYTASGDCSAHAHQRGDKLQIVCFHVLDH
jgi:hypothetical protein